MSKKVAEKLLRSDYEGFVAVMDEADNVVDVYVEADDLINSETAVYKVGKKEIESNIKKLKLSGEALRENMLRYVRDKGVERFDGVKAKSITFQAEKEVIGVKSVRQIMVGRQYQDLDILSKEDLVVMLERKGVKTRVLSEETKTVKEASIRVLR